MSCVTTQGGVLYWGRLHVRIIQLNFYLKSQPLGKEVLKGRDFLT